MRIVSAKALDVAMTFYLSLHFLFPASIQVHARSYIKTSAATWLRVLLGDSFLSFFVCVCMHIFNAFSDFYANMLSLKLLHATKLFLLLGIARHSAEYVNLC